MWAKAPDLENISVIKQPRLSIVKQLTARPAAEST